MKSMTCRVASLVLGLAAADLRAQTEQYGPDQMTPAPAEPLQVEVQKVAMNGAVEDIDVNNRKLKVRMADGEVINIKVIPEVEDLEKINKGDPVKVSYLKSVALSLHKEGDLPPVEAAGTVQLILREGKPETAVVNTVEVAGLVEDIDRERRTITIRGPHRDIIKLEVPAEDPAFARIKQGDKVITTYNEALAVEVVRG